MIARSAAPLAVPRAREVTPVAAVTQLPALSPLALRQRTIRLWLAAVGIAAFGVTYVAPLALALTRPPLAVALPELRIAVPTLPRVDVPKLRAAPVTRP